MCKLLMQTAIVLSALLLLEPSYSKETSLGFYNGNSLKTGLTSSGPEPALASGYILGIFDFLAHDKLICPGKGVTGDQVVALVKLKLEQSPQYWDAPAAQIVSAFLIDTWPCT